MKKILTLLFFLGLILCCLTVPVSAEGRAAPTTTTAALAPIAPINPVTLVPVGTTATPYQPQTGVITISSSPSGANVIVDGNAMGTTPFTTRTLTVGSHSLLLQMTGYLDHPATFTIQPDQLNQQSYTLSPVQTTIIPQVTRVQTTVPVTTIPVTAATTIRLPQTTVPVTTQTRSAPADSGTAPPGKVRKDGIFAQMRFTGPVAVEPITVTIGDRKYMPVLTTDSPYFRYQLKRATGTTSNISIADVDLFIPPQTLLEVDRNAVPVNIKSAVTCSSTENCPPKPAWDDNAQYFIKDDDKFYNRSHFRWSSLEPDATAFYQISRYPFPADNVHWQNQYIPGLVGSGPAKEIFVDSKGNHYFDLNFALPANHKGGDPPYYTGTVYLDNPKYGKGVPLGMTKLPFGNAGILSKKVSFGSFSFGVPSGITGISEGDLVESDLGNPNENMLSICTECMELRNPTTFESALLGMDKTFYVRVVPIRKNGVAGTPTLSVKITVTRPQLCPTDPKNTTINVVVKPPSVKVASFYLQAFARNDWIHTDQNGVLVAPAYYLSVAPPADCAIYDSLNDMQKGATQCNGYRALTGGGNPNYHFIIDPPESHWYDTVWDILSGLFMAFSTVTNAVSGAWANIQALAVKIVAVAIQVISFNTIKCSESDVCKGVLQTGLSIAMTYFGVPPTIPNFAELESMGTDYIASMAAEELGAGEIYENLPDSVKNEMTGKATDVSNEMAGSLKSNTGSVTAAAAGSWYIPDPLYYEPHQAFVIVRVSNPNSQPTDSMFMKVHDTQGLYEETDPMYIPPLKAGESMAIPVTLRERFMDVYEPGCTKDSYTLTCDGGYSNCIPCYWNLWYFKAKTNSETIGADQFYATLHTRKGGYTINYLTPQSNGKKLDSESIQTFDEQGTACKVTYSKTLLRYPIGWQMQQTPFSQTLMQVIWGKYSFTNGNTGILIGT
jgi:hypothetical protein